MGTDKKTILRLEEIRDYLKENDAPKVLVKTLSLHIGRQKVQPGWDTTDEGKNIRRKNRF